MDKIGLGLELDNSQSRSAGTPRDPKEQRKASIEKCIKFLVHATQCHSAHCNQPSCIKMKRVLTHTRECKLMITGKWNQCTVCKQFVLLCISHAKSCTSDQCPVPVCARIKKNLRDQRNQRRVAENRFEQQRMAAQMHAMTNAASGSAAASSVGGGGSGPSSQHNVSSPAPPNTSPSNPASNSSPSKATKGSPASTAAVNHPSNPASNKPYMSAPSPAAGPLSVGKGGGGGPRTPNPGGPASVQKAASMMVNSPAVHGHLSPAPSPSIAGKPDSGPNMMVQATTGLPQELQIQKIGQATNNQMVPHRDMRGMMVNRVAPGQQDMMMTSHHPQPAGMNHMQYPHPHMQSVPRVQQQHSFQSQQAAIMQQRYRSMHQGTVCVCVCVCVCVHFVW